MHYDLKKPCDNCPFVRKGGIRLHPGRVHEIAEGMLHSQGHTFACHKTTVSEENEEGDSDRVIAKNSRHCAGALIFAEKNDNATQMMRISERLGLYDRQALMSNKAITDLVFETLDEMLEANRDNWD